jgi:hypothetical protein
MHGHMNVKSILLLPSHLRLGLPSGLFPSGIHIKPCMHLSPIRSTWAARFIILDFITPIIFDEEYRS